MILQNSELSLANSFTFDQGSLEVLDSVTFSTPGNAQLERSNQAKFVFTSNCGASIQPDATLTFDQDFYFKYDSPLARGIELVDPSATLHLRGATLDTVQRPLELDSGTLRIEEHSVLTNTATNCSEAPLLRSEDPYRPLNVHVLAGAVFDVDGLIRTQ